MKNPFVDEIKLIDLLIKNGVSNSSRLERTPLEMRKPGYKKVSSGGMGCYNKDEIKS